MGALIDSATWGDVPYFEANAVLTGGPDCPDNVPLQALANRTAFLKALADGLTAGKQPLDATLTALATIVTAADKLIYATGVDTFAITSLSAFARTLLDDVDAATARATLGAAPLDSPAMTGTPTVPTAPAGTNTAQSASTAFVQAAIAALVASSPAALDTLNELAAALGNDPNFATTITNALALKAPLVSPAFTGSPTVPMPPQFDSSTKPATTAFAKAMGLSFAGVVYLNSLPSTLDTSYAGKLTVINGGAAGTVTLPLSSGFPGGAAIILVNESIYAQTISRQGADIIVAGNSNSANSYVMEPGTFAVFTSDTSAGGGWHMGLRTAQLGLTGAFGSSLASNGYQRLPSGLIIQWGARNSTASTDTLTLPLAFPNAALQAYVTDSGNGRVAFGASFASTSTVTVYCASAGNLYHYFAIGC
ncbi:gp53-like domain-containing protein [Chromobacterium haemolyticum]|uniref:gp53-like domain-containing protein n=1 Tax=Chromobacterium haemolyticum TaxID=394935 RepID=UPI0015932EF4|nr:hypothetical protein [Chromobacterium haemolyticum]